MSFEFPYQYGLIDNRKIPYPIVPILLRTVRGIRQFSFIMDTGADMLTLPHYMVKLLGLNKASLIPSISQGIGKSLVKTWEGNIIIGLCKRELHTACSFTDNDTTPFLLGKIGIFDQFTVIFDNDNHRTVFQERK